MSRNMHNGKGASQAKPTAAGRRPTGSSGRSALIVLGILILAALGGVAIRYGATNPKDDTVPAELAEVARKPIGIPVIMSEANAAEMAPAPAAAATPATGVTYRIAEPGQVSAGVYDAEGRLVRSLMHGKRQEPGEYTLRWDGLDRDGNPMEPGDYEVRILRTPGFTAHYITALGIRPSLSLNDPAYRRNARIWAGSHGGPAALALDGTNIYISAGTAEFTPIMFKQSLDGTQRMWSHNEYEVAQGPIALAYAHGRLLALHRNGKAMIIDPSSGRKTGEWDLLHEAVTRRRYIFGTHGFTSGEWVYTSSTIDMSGQGDTVVVSHNGQNVLRWLDAEGNTAAEINVPSPRGVFVDHNGRVLVISEGRVLAVTREGAERTVVEGLINPIRLAVDPGNGDILVVEQAPSHQIKRFSESGRLQHTYGREGGRQDGPYVPTDFHGVTSIVIASNGNFYIAEPSGAPRRVARFNREGYLLNDWPGPTGFFASAAPDPNNPTNVWYSPQGGYLVLTEVDYEGGDWKILETHRVGDRGDGIFMRGLASAHRPVSVRYHDGQRYLVFNTSPPNIFLHTEGRLVPLVAGATTGGGGDHGDVNLRRAVEIAGGDPNEARGFVWHDHNRDGNVQPEEIQLFQQRMPTLPKIQAPLGIGFDVFNFSWQGQDIRIHRLSPINWINGLPEYPTVWDTLHHLAMPAGSRYEVTGFLEAEDALYLVKGCGMDRHGTAFPTDRIGKARVVKLAPDGEILWSIGTGATQDPHNVRNPSPPGHFYEPTGFVGHVRGTVVVCDRSVHPATAWTEDGLYAGYFLDHRADDGLPNTLYRWFSTLEGWDDAILNYDHEVPGRIVEHEGEVYWFSNGWQCVPVYRITGWDNWERQEHVVSITQRPASAQRDGTGLRGDYYANTEFEGEPAMQRPDGPIWFTSGDWYGTQTEVWSNGPRGLDRSTDFSVRWVGEVEAPLTEEFIFSINANGKVRLWVAGQQLIHGWNTSGTGRVSEPVRLEAGKRYPIRLDFSTSSRQPTCNLNWESFSIDRERVPRVLLYPDGDGGDVDVQPRKATSRIAGGSYEASEGPVSVQGQAVKIGSPGGGMAGYENLDFGDGVTRMHAACNTWSGIAGPTVVEVRVDAPTGPVIGTLRAPASNSAQPVVIDLTRNISGVRNIYFVNVPDAGGQWAQIQWFRFE